MLLVSKDIREMRMDTCRACQHYVAATKSCGPLVTEAFTDSKLCGCFMPAKSRLKVASCPLDKWGATITKDDLEAIRHMLENKQEYTNEDLVQWHNKMTGGNKKRSTCAPCNNTMVKDLRRLLESAKKDA